jgi:hypothetical protein
VLYFDLDVNDWVRKPGSTSPPWMEPVLTLGSVFEIAVTFCRGGEVVSVSSSDTWLCGIKLQGDYSGPYVASSTTAINRGGPDTSFILDLTTVAGATYFTDNPTESIAACELQVRSTVGSVVTATTRLPVTLQNAILD